MGNSTLRVKLTNEDMLKLNKDGGLTVKSEDKFVTILSVDTKDGTLDMCSFKDTHEGLKPVTIITKFDMENGQHFFNTIRFGSKTFDNRDIHEVYSDALTNAKELKIYKNEEKEIVPIDIGDLSEEFSDIILEAIEEARKKEDAEVLLEIDGEIYHLDGSLYDAEIDPDKIDQENDKEQEDDKDNEDNLEDKDLMENDDFDSYEDGNGDF